MAPPEATDYAQRNCWPSVWINPWGSSASSSSLWSLGQLIATEPVMVGVLAVVGWLFWAVFVAEFLLRAYIAGFRTDFWRRRSWWQVIFLLVTFLRFFRLLQALRLVRIARLRLAGRFPAPSGEMPAVP